jgi:hypothetical protein
MPSSVETETGASGDVGFAVGTGRGCLRLLWSLTRTCSCLSRHSEKDRKGVYAGDGGSIIGVAADDAALASSIIEDIRGVLWATNAGAAVDAAFEDFVSASGRYSAAAIDKDAGSS